MKTPGTVRAIQSDGASGLARRNLSLSIAHQIEEHIRSSGLVPGSKLPGERLLSRSYGISRTVLREAIDILENKGIVETSAARGVFVANASFEKTASAVSEHLVRAAVPLREFIEARRFLEIHIATLAAENRTEADLAALRENFHRMVSAIDDPDLFFREDIDFHTLMARASGNQLYPVWLQPIMENLMHLSSHKLLHEVRERIIICHRTILVAVEAADPGAAKDAVARHIDQYEDDAYAFST